MSLQLSGMVIGDSPTAKPGDRLWIASSCLGGLSVAGPADGVGLVPVLPKVLLPVVPRLGVQPQAMDEDDRRPATRGGCARTHEFPRGYSFASLRSIRANTPMSMLPPLTRHTTRPPGWLASSAAARGAAPAPSATTRTRSATVHTRPDGDVPRAPATRRQTDPL